MTIKKPLPMILAATLLIGTLPVNAGASEEPGYHEHPVGSALARSIDQTAIRLAAQARRASRPTAAARERDGLEMQGTGGGGHAGMLVLTLVTTAASIGGGYYLYKQMKKQTDQLSK
jgi:hypothetical protein